MAWETRRGRGRYYTRSRRIDGRVVREYVGGGIAAEHEAAKDEAERADRMEQRQRERIGEQKMDTADDDAVQLFDQITALTSATLVLDGFHRHKYEWRPRRGY